MNTLQIINETDAIYGDAPVDVNHFRIFKDTSGLWFVLENADLYYELAAAIRYLQEVGLYDGVVLKNTLFNHFRSWSDLLGLDNRADSTTLTPSEMVEVVRNLGAYRIIGWNGEVTGYDFRGAIDDAEMGILKKAAPSYDLSVQSIQEAEVW